MSRPTRVRKAPERFGELVGDTKEVDALLASDESGDDAPPARKRQRRGKQPAAAPAHSDDDSSEGEDAGDEEEGGGSEVDESSDVEDGRAGPSRRRAAAAKPPPLHVPAPPAEPRSRGDMMSLLFACPSLIDSLLEPDGLRTISLVARDAAQLAICLGARAADMNGIWEQLARRCQPGFSGGADEALEVVRRAVRADPARAQELNTKTAESRYRVTRGELKSLPHMTRYSQSFWSDTVKMYSKLDVLAIAHRKWGSMKVLEWQLQLAADKKRAAKDKRESAADRRSKEISKLLSKEGLQGPTSRKHTRAGRRLMKAYIKKGQGTAADIVAAVKNESAEESARLERARQMHSTLLEQGMCNSLYDPAIQAWIRGVSQHGTAAEVVAVVKAAKAAKEAGDQRRTAVIAALAAEGLSAYAPTQTYYAGWGRCRVPGFDDFVQTAAGSQEAVLEAARELHAAEQARRQRTVDATQALTAEGLREFGNSGLPGWRSWVDSGSGSLEALLAAARQSQQAVQAQAARRTHMEQLLTAEGLQEYRRLPAVASYVAERCTQEAVLQAAREAAADAAARAERRATLLQALAGEGIPWDAVFRAPFVHQYEHGRNGGANTLEAALAAARQEHAQQQAREARTAELAAAFTAAGLDVQNWRYRLGGMAAFLSRGEGSAEALVGQAQAAAQAAAHVPALHGYVV